MNSTDLPSPEIPGPPHAGRPRFNWWMFVAVLLAPTLLTALCVLLFDKKGDTAPVIAVFGGGLAGIISGIMLGRHFGRTLPTKVVSSVLFALILGAACITMSCCGCMLSGYQFNLH